MTKAFLARYAKKLTKERGLKVTPEEAEHVVVEMITRIAKDLAGSFVFGYHQRSDIIQQGILFALEVLNTNSYYTKEPLYDIEKPLENFLRRHVKNRLHNYKRDQYLRSEAPCECCEPFNPPASPCKRWQKWYQRNLAKQNLMRPIDVDIICDTDKALSMVSTVIDNVSYTEFESVINGRLPAELRSDYLRLKAGLSIPKVRREAIAQSLEGVLGEY